MKPQKILRRERRHHRIRMRGVGSESKPRLVVYRSLKFNYACLVDDLSGKTLLSASDRAIKNQGKKAKGLKKVDSAKQVGLALAKKALEKKISMCIFDRAGYKYHGRVKALADGAREGGLKF